MENYRILIIGASGLVGSNCKKYLASQDKFMVMGTYFKFQQPDLEYYDTLNPENPLNADVISFRPTHILHAGALTHVDFCEQNPEDSYMQTVVSTKNIIKVAEITGASLIYISTDYVFDGENGPYTENDPTHPISVYGKHKLEAENLVFRHSDNNLVLRVTNVYGDEVRNKNFISRLLEMGKENKKTELNLPADQFATPVNAFDIARALYILLSESKNGIYNIASTDYLNRVQLAEKVLSRFPGNNVKIIARKTSEMNQPADRPLQGGLKSGKFLNEYPYFSYSSVDQYVDLKVDIKS